MDAFLFLVGALATVAILIACFCHPPRVRAADPRWDGAPDGSVPLYAAPLGAYRDAGSLATLHSGAPPPVRAASFLATAATLFCLPHAFLAPFALAGALGGAAWTALPGVLLLVLGLAAIVVLDYAGFSLLQRTTTAAALARRLRWVLALEAAQLAAAIPFAFVAREGYLGAFFLVGPAAMLGAGLFVRHTARRYSSALAAPRSDLL